MLHVDFVKRFTNALKGLLEMCSIPRSVSQNPSNLHPFSSENDENVMSRMFLLLYANYVVIYTCILKDFRNALDVVFQFCN